MKAFLLAALLPLAAFAQSSPPGQPQILTTPDGVRFGLWPDRPKEPAPVVFAFAGQLEETLTFTYFRQSAHYLATDGVVCVSVDLPCHGADEQPTEKGLTGLAQAHDRGEDFVAKFTRQLRGVLDHLIAEKIADPARIAALGTSRGGFIAAHFAIAEPRVQHVLAFAPVTDLAQLREFQTAADDPLVQSLSLEKHAAALVGRNLWLVIGDRDTRVSTDHAIRFARAVTAAGLAANKPTTVDLHVITEPKGHTVPEGFAEVGAHWLRSKFGLPAAPAISPNP